MGLSMEIERKKLPKETLEEQKRICEVGQPSSLSMTSRQGCKHWVTQTILAVTVCQKATLMQLSVDKSTNNWLIDQMNTINSTRGGQPQFRSLM